MKEDENYNDFLNSDEYIDWDSYREEEQSSEESD